MLYAEQQAADHLHANIVPPQEVELDLPEEEDHSPPASPNLPLPDVVAPNPAPYIHPALRSPPESYTTTDTEEDEPDH